MRFAAIVTVDSQHPAAVPLLGKFERIVRATIYTRLEHRRTRLAARFTNRITFLVARFSPCRYIVCHRLPFILRFRATR